MGGDDAGILLRLVEGTARATGEEFFHSLVTNLALAMGAGYAFIAGFAGSSRRLLCRGLAVLVLAGCAAPPREIPAELLDCPEASSAQPISWTPLAWAGEPTPQCLARPEVASYQRELHARMYRAWRVPGDAAVGDRALLRFRLDADGRIRGACLLRADNESLGESAVRALFRASPYPAMNEQARCLADRRLIATFSLPPR